MVCSKKMSYVTKPLTITVFADFLGRESNIEHTHKLIAIYLLNLILKYVYELLGEPLLVF